MKTRFSTVDLIASLTELQQKLVGMRLNQVYDIDNKSYLMRFARSEEKAVLLLESGIRIHTTEFEWPKNPAPSGFTMKLRKHLKNKRLESITQLGVDRMVDLQFGINEVAYHVILELYDRGNIVLTDHQYVIQNILRPRASGSEDVKFVVRETYPIQAAKSKEDSLSKEQLTELFQNAKPNENIKKLLNPKLICGPAILEHVLLSVGIPVSSKLGKDITVDNVPAIYEALIKAEGILAEATSNSCKGYIIQKLNKLSSTLPGQTADKETLTFDEFHPFLFKQHEGSQFIECETFNKAIDIFFSSIEGQKIDIKTMAKEREAYKKLENVKKDHEKRVIALQKSQLSDVQRAQLIEMNLPLIDNAILVIRSAIANQIPWSEIWNIIKEAQAMGDPVARSIIALKLDSNHFTINLKDPFDTEVNEAEPEKINMQTVDIDLDLSAYANARKYYDKKRQAAKKEQKTLESSHKAYKNAEKKTKQTLKEVAVKSTIMKARKTFWFEKFLWFISSENYLIIAGRDIPQNELIVKRYMKPGDVYVHADIHGASSVVIKNPTGQPIPPKTQNEAGVMAVCCSAAWEAKVVTSAWWVFHHQVSKTAPSGEYLTPGSFMIRGKKNYLPPSHLIMGFGFIFRLDDESIERHAGERTVSHAEVEVVEDNHDDDVELVLEEEDDEKPQDKVEPEPVVPKNELDDQSESDKEEPSLFPDTVVRVDRWPSESEPTPSTAELEKPLDNDEKPARGKSVKAKKKCEPKPELQVEPKPQQSKRGQKSKLKKMEKYKDQDEEERQLRMEILGSAGMPKEPTLKGKKGKKAKENLVKNAAQNKPKEKVRLSSVIFHEEEAENIEETKVPSTAPSATQLDLEPEGTQIDRETTEVQSDDETEEGAQVADELKILDTLTGCPVSEDGLLFAVPVCAPYAALQNYKYKVKVTPGTGKRGKAAKTALNTFLRDKTATSREKDLLKSVKDQDISRNLPGKVKLSAPNLVKLKK